MAFPTYQIDIVRVGNDALVTIQIGIHTNQYLITGSQAAALLAALGL